MGDLIRRYLSAITAALVAAMGAMLYLRGRKDADANYEMQEHNEYVETRKRMDETDGPSDADVAKWLRERGKRNGSL